MAIPQSGAAIPKIGAPGPAPRPRMRAVPTAARRPIATAVRSIGGSERCGEMTSSVSLEKENRTARPTRIGGFAKGASLVKRKKRRLASSLTTCLLLLLRGLLRLLLRWHQWITSSWPRIDGYIDTLTLQMSTRETRATSGGRRRHVASKSLGHALTELVGGEVGGPAVADHLQKALLEHDRVPTVIAPFEVARHLRALGGPELLVEELVELLEAVVAVHPHPPSPAAAR